MLTVLINAYACSPNMGSEPGMAWNWCVNLANYCNLHIITEGEFRDKIEVALKELPQAKNMHFYYNPVSNKVRKMCWNQGDWRFYKYYKQWQYKTYLLSLDILKEHKIDIIHQLNMIGFREPGYLWKIENVPYIWGPIGGLMTIPCNYIPSRDVKKKIFTLLKIILNKIQIKYHPRVKKALQHASFVIGATSESVNSIEKYHHRKATLINETGCYVNRNIITTTSCNEDVLHIVWAGRFVYMKKLDLALKIISKLKDLKIKFHIVGGGSSLENQHYKDLASTLDIQDMCIWHGAVSHSEVQNIMLKSDIFFFTSVAEGTPHVVLEAISNNLPIVCFDCCGQGDSVNEKIGVKVKISNPEQSVYEFVKIITHLYYHREILKSMSQNCVERQQELSWENKAKTMNELYKNALQKTN